MLANVKVPCIISNLGDELMGCQSDNSNKSVFLKDSLTKCKEPIIISISLNANSSSPS